MTAADPHPRRTAEVLDTTISYVDTGSGDPVVFLHGNPTSSYLWRNVIPHVPGRRLAPDLVGMGQSGASASGSYRFVDHYAHVEAWMEAADVGDDVTLVIHDWGSALGFHWAHLHPERVKALVYMEAIVRPVMWSDWPDEAEPFFRGLRSDAGESMVLERNLFIEAVLPASVMRPLTDEEMTRYRSPYLEPGESRRPMLTWPREIPIDGEPADVHEVVAAYRDWLTTSDVPKLFVSAEPGAVLVGSAREFCRTFPNQTEVTVTGSHFIQEDSPKEIGTAIRDFLAGLEN